MGKRKGSVANKISPDVLIIGAMGQVGVELARLLPEEYCLPRAREMLDICDRVRVQDVIECIRPGIVVNLAATNPVVGATAKQHWEVNAAGVAFLSKTCAMNGAALIHFSTGEIFAGNPSTAAYPELSTPCPTSAFSMSKVAGEHAILSLGQYPSPDFLDFRYWIIRSSLVIGRPTRYHHNNFAVRLEQVLQGRGNVVLPEDAVRSVIYAPHLAKHIAWLIENYRKVPSGVYHLANHGHPSLYDLVSHAQVQLGRKSQSRAVRRSVADLRTLGDDHVVPGELYANGALNCERWADLCPLPLVPWRSAIDDFCEDYKRCQT